MHVHVIILINAHLNQLNLMYTVSGNGKVSRFTSIYLHFLPPVNQLIDNAMQLCYK